MPENSKKTSLLEKGGDFIIKHPFASALVIVILEISFFFLLVQFTGCLGQRFANGDRTKYNPADYEVIDPGMAKPEAE